jgi:hypothetical protein
LENGTDEEAERLVKTLMDVGVDEHADLNQDDDGTDTDDDNEDNDDTAGRITLTARIADRIRERFDLLTRLRRAFLKYSDEEMREYTSHSCRIGA